MMSKVSERFFTFTSGFFFFASGILFFILGFFLPPVTSESQWLFENVIFNASLMFGGICFMVSAFER